MRDLCSGHVLLLGLTLLLGCRAGSTGGPAAPTAPDAPAPVAPAPPPRPAVWDVDALGVPQFVTVDYIEAARIAQVSRFRSSAGHDYSDDVEACRSMKHYFQPAVMAEAGQTVIRAPVTGAVTRVIEEWAGTQIQITSDEYPAFTFILFHVRMPSTPVVGQSFAAGQLLGTHIGSQTASDIAVAVVTPTGRRFVSWFDVMTDGLFATYVARGASARSSLIISRIARDADPLTCDAVGNFVTRGTLESWVLLR